MGTKNILNYLFLFFLSKRKLLTFCSPSVFAPQTKIMGLFFLPLFLKIQECV